MIDPEIEQDSHKELPCTLGWGLFQWGEKKKKKLNAYSEGTKQHLSPLWDQKTSQFGG